MVRALPVASACLIRWVERLVSVIFLRSPVTHAAGVFQVGQQLPVYRYRSTHHSADFFSHACCVQLLEQVLGGFMEFFGKLSHGIQ